MRLLYILISFLLTTNIYAVDKIYNIDLKKSVVHWTGSKIVGKHTGTLLFKEGNIVVNDKGQFVSGNFAVDMKTLNDEDQTGEMKGKLEGHLKSEDFFAVEKFPASNLKFTKVTLKTKGIYNVDALLTIKGKSAPVSFIAKAELKEGKFILGETAFNFDRTVYDIRYGSGKFFQNLGDKVINDTIELKVDIVAGK